MPIKEGRDDSDSVRAKASPQIKHDVVAQYVANTRFPWPDQNTNPEVTEKYGIWPHDYVTIVNVRSKQKAVQFGTQIGYPDIVIVNAKGEVREIGEIEPEDSFSPAIIDKWKGYAAAATIGPKGYPKFFIYVPASELKATESIIEENKFKFAGLRTYEISDDLNTLKLNIIKTNEL
jgi:hypothetical protein